MENRQQNIFKKGQMTLINMKFPKPLISRAAFLQKSLISTASMMLPLSLIGRDFQQEKPPPIKLEIIKEYITVAHGQFPRLKEMLENDKQLLHVSYDWGGGDYESAIEAAGHVGNREIAAYLIGKGARYNIYLASMLGHLDIVKQVLTLNPGLLNSKGPHGFTLLHHANKGGEPSRPVADYLIALGAKETKIDFYARA